MTIPIVHLVARNRAVKVVSLFPISPLFIIALSLKLEKECFLTTSSSQLHAQFSAVGLLVSTYFCLKSIETIIWENI